MVDTNGLLREVYGDDVERIKATIAHLKALVAISPLNDPKDTSQTCYALERYLETLEKK